MIYFDRNRLLQLNPRFLKQQRVSLLILSLLLLLGGLFCLFRPLTSGDALSAMVGILLLLSGIGLIIGMIANRANNFWPMIGGILMGAAYLVMGFIFIRNPEVGLFTVAVLVATLFALGGIARLMAGVKLKGAHGGWLQIIIGLLDLLIAWMLISAGPQGSILLVTMIVGIEMLFSSFSLFQVAQLLKQR
ncbi:HdeD family acid-resistance protein [Edwardsiella ictaluri]|uniref:HdeD family acid-resistance protein n=1 Tax=Edwardsiella ictaluri TaxID=67780 RepID=UPI0009BEF01E|nr:HdeD family acid-resistance protein [Edwardsiella ictaluri]ARD40096.1 acid-resistance protein [Edwardsiella ictaluri]QPW25636.1 HdeD family acid-resistance protein [Edwardsiella ictaluri]